MVLLVLGAAELCRQGGDVLLGGAEVRNALHVEERLPVHVLDLLEEVHLLLHGCALAAHKTHNPGGLGVEKKDLHPADVGRREHAHHVLFLCVDDVNVHFFFWFSFCLVNLPLLLLVICVCLIISLKNFFFSFLFFFLFFVRLLIFNNSSFF